MKRILVFRFSAMGDVAMTMTALKKVIIENPDIKIYYVTRKKFFPFFQNYPQIELINADFEGEHKSFSGLLHLFKTLKNLKPDVIIDLHQNIRTTVLKSLFAIIGKKSFTINKGRTEKKSFGKQ